MLGAIAATAFETTKTSRIPTNSCFRSRCDRAAVRGGPNSITVKANKVTNWPAVEIDISRSRARAGRIPRMMYSVVTIRNAATARRKIERPGFGMPSRSVDEGKAEEVVCIDDHHGNEDAHPGIMEIYMCLWLRFPAIMDWNSRIGTSRDVAGTAQGHRCVRRSR